MHIAHIIVSCKFCMCNKCVWIGSNEVNNIGQQSTQKTASPVLSGQRLTTYNNSKQLSTLHRVLRLLLLCAKRYQCVRNIHIVKSSIPNEK